MTDYACPECGKPIGTSTWPTVEEYRANWLELTRAERNYTLFLEQTQKKAHELLAQGHTPEMYE